MKEVSSQEFQKHFGVYQDSALMEPLAITKHGRPRLVVMSVEEYKGLRKGLRRSMRITELPDYIMKAIEEAEIPESLHQFDDEMDE